MAAPGLHLPVCELGTVQLLPQRAPVNGKLLKPLTSSLTSAATAAAS